MKIRKMQWWEYLPVAMWNAECERIRQQQRPNAVPPAPDEPSALIPTTVDA